MKFRIKEVKRSGRRIAYVPEYKYLLFWHKVSNSDWADTIFCEYKFNDYVRGSLYTKTEAINCIEDFKLWLEDQKEYDVIHKVN